MLAFTDCHASLVGGSQHGYMGGISTGRSCTKLTIMAPIARGISSLVNLGPNWTNDVKYMSWIGHTVLGPRNSVLVTTMIGSMQKGKSCSCFMLLYLPFYNICQGGWSRMWFTQLQELG